MAQMLRSKRIAVRKWLGTGIFQQLYDLYVAGRLWWDSLVTQPPVVHVLARKVRDIWYNCNPVLSTMSFTSISADLGLSIVTGAFFVPLMILYVSNMYVLMNTNDVLSTKWCKRSACGCFDHAFVGYTSHVISQGSWAPKKCSLKMERMRDPLGENPWYCIKQMGIIILVA